MNDSEWGAGWVQSLAGSREVSQHSSDFHTLELGGGGGGSLTRDFGGSCFPGKGHLSLGTNPGGWRRRGKSGTELGCIGGILFLYRPSWLRADGSGTEPAGG